MRTIIIVSLMLLAGCDTASGPQFSQPANPSIIVYHHDTQIRIAHSPIPLSINDRQCDLHQDAFIILPNAKYTLLVSMMAWPGVSKQTINTASNNQYYRVEIDKTKQAWMALSFAGGVIAESASEHSGPVIFTRINEAQALQDLHGLRQDCM